MIKNIIFSVVDGGSRFFQNISKLLSLHAITTILHDHHLENVRTL